MPSPDMALGSRSRVREWVEAHLRGFVRDKAGNRLSIYDMRGGADRCRELTSGNRHLFSSTWQLPTLPSSHRIGCRHSPSLSRSTAAWSLYLSPAMPIRREHRFASRSSVIGLGIASP